MSTVVFRDLVVSKCHILHSMTEGLLYTNILLHLMRFLSPSHNTVLLTTPFVQCDHVHLFSVI